jgi:response regulator of citrate/malate metabolism
VSAPGPIRVLVVEDEPIAAEAHAAYVGRLDHFALVGVVHSAADAVRLLRREPVDLLLLDLHLPDGHGLALLQRLRADGVLADVIAVTSARDKDVVRQAATQGVANYLLKPFTFAGFKAKLEQYAAYRAQLAGSAQTVVQGEIDAMFDALHRPATGLPKGMSPETMSTVLEALRASGAGESAGLSASEVADRTGTSRVTARRYLEHLAGAGEVVRGHRYGAGRPEVEYRLRSGRS